ncbi:hypothetical protein Rumeso_04085 [Rubellimicrobium mesophilum DSM 19309]|uniref:Uncharacterized protein n=1 Tax=Rubellimicrobium mesophilum DSM 19309 TaxID=442562 RepID=A0A017HJ92_9RHOB|nr:DUF1413 domain-containing protein [Rubellimicrobium mesophilum]EYD74400.1 hypothetical protein Rumeso_04085 [Rubellimicrobium mesophilum DSM 19309]
MDLETFRPRVHEALQAWNVGQQFTLKDLFEAQWGEVAQPTTFGQDFLAAVRRGEFPDIEERHKDGANHQWYRRIR